MNDPKKKKELTRISNKHTDSLIQQGKSIEYITGAITQESGLCLKGNIENHIGYCQIPIGLTCTLAINTTSDNHEIRVPLATTEGALVASYSRGIKAMTLSGGTTAVSLGQEVQRCPSFQFDSVVEAIDFKNWVNQNKLNFQTIIDTTSQYTKFNRLNFTHEGNSLIIELIFTTGDAAGQNMITIATHNICEFLLSESPVKPTQWYIEGNLAGDKKATQRSLTQKRGRKVIAECILKKEIVATVLNTTPQKILEYWQESNLAMFQSGAIGNHGHIANGLTALYLACGQDVASVTESAVGILRMQITNNSDLYVSLTLPNLIVGTVGGGTKLRTQHEALKIMDCAGPGKAEKFAQICCATALAGELSIAAAMASKEFTKAHQQLGRK